MVTIGDDCFIGHGVCLSMIYLQGGPAQGDKSMEVSKSQVTKLSIVVAIRWHAHLKYGDSVNLWYALPWPLNISLSRVL
jgi:hypothetical protein